LSATQAFEVVAIVAIVVAVGAGAGLALVYRRLQRYLQNQRLIMGPRGNVDIVEHVAAVDDKVGNLRLAVEDLTLAVRDHDVRIDNSLSRVGVVRFDAYEDLGGRQSTAVAFLNPLGNGVVITTVVSRDFARMYVKLLKEGVPDIPLAPEEIEAVEQARGSAPFTILPRPETVGQKPEEKETAGGAAAVGAPSATGLPGRRRADERELARENRRRQRQGLPPLDDLVVPSALGWPQPATPAPVTPPDTDQETGDGQEMHAAGEPAEEPQLVDTSPAQTGTRASSGETGRATARISGKTLAERFLVERRSARLRRATEASPSSLYPPSSLYRDNSNKEGGDTDEL